MTRHHLHDPLLSGTRFLLTALLIVFALALIALAVTVLALPFPLVQGQIADLRLAAGVTTWAFTARLLVMMAMISAILALVFFFLLHLRRIVDSVGAGDPFVPVNARRLNTMGWLMVALTLAFPLLPVVSDWVNQLLQARTVAEGFEFQPDGLLLALVLFILARVFRHGTAMRADLEGTV